MYKRIRTPPDPSDTQTDHALIFEGYSQFHKIIYIRETLVGEGCIPSGCTVADVETLLSMSIEAESGNNGGNISARMAKKCQNFRDAVEFVFPSWFDSGFPNPADFTPDFLLTVHRYIGSNRLITDAGSYRTKWLAPAKEDFVYLDPVRVPIELPRLCFDVQIALRNDSCLLNRVRLAAAFATNFLYIHPFSNGNGRVARLAVSWLLKGHTVVPVPLYGDREVYLDCLRDSRVQPFIPQALARFVLDSVERVHQDVLNCLF
ncbi:fido domain-containing protein [Blyttiomyces helicus]|uniref:Fido domain-containing protein n=1 Tax=Blyttiomyces helicus TaxID=388810 RepID=A0A4V1IR00_9FUNG|nr:fido domain-containing protein [Blyttiomyces helicus]|eukprot:RKO88327.1 fido domain-containing protein [Blyttiomyces helicus]